MKVSIIIVSWNVKVYLSDCIDSIKKHPTKYDCEIIIVDNASADGTVLHLDKHYPNIKLITNNENIGFGRANNQGAMQAKGDYLFILNPDTLFLEGTIDKLVGFMDANLDIAICGPRVLNEDGSTQRSVRNFQTWKSAFCRYSLLKYLGIFNLDLEHWRYRNFNYDEQGDVEQLIGAALLVRREVFQQLDGFDEIFFMYYEEVDLCYRIKASGLRSTYFPKAALVHLGGKSSNQVRAKKKFMMLQSLVRYLKKHSDSSWDYILPSLFKLGVLSLQLHELFFNFILYWLSASVLSKKRKNKYKDRYIVAYEFLTKHYLEFLKT